MPKNFTRGHGSVYKDLEFENPEEWEAKSRLACEIMKAIRQKEWTQAEAAKFLGIKRGEISNINRGQFDRFTIDRLLLYLRKLELSSQSNYRKS